MAVIVQNGLERMYGNGENVWYYITAMNEIYQQPALPEGEEVIEGIIKGLYNLEENSARASVFS